MNVIFIQLWHGIRYKFPGLWANHQSSLLNNTSINNDIPLFVHDNHRASYLNLYLAKPYCTYPFHIRKPMLMHTPSIRIYTTVSPMPAVLYCTIILCYTVLNTVQYATFPIQTHSGWFDLVSDRKWWCDGQWGSQLHFAFVDHPRFCSFPLRHVICSVGVKSYRIKTLGLVS